MDRLSKAFSFGIVVFAVMMAAIVGMRIDQFTMSMLGGAFLGLLIAVPTTLLATTLATRNPPLQARERALTHSSPLPQSPPQYWVMPTQPPVPAQAGSPPLLANTAIHWNLTPENLQLAPRRKFYVIGESGTMEEINAPSEPDPDFRVINPHTLGAASI